MAKPNMQAPTNTIPGQMPQGNSFMGSMQGGIGPSQNMMQRLFGGIGNQGIAQRMPMQSPNLTNYFGNR